MFKTNDSPYFGTTLRSCIRQGMIFFIITTVFFALLHRDFTFERVWESFKGAVIFTFLISVVNIGLIYRQKLQNDKNNLCK